MPKLWNALYALLWILATLAKTNVIHDYDFFFLLSMMQLYYCPTVCTGTFSQLMLSCATPVELEYYENMPMYSSSSSFIYTTSCRKAKVCL